MGTDILRYHNSIPNRFVPRNPNPNPKINSRRRKRNSSTRESKSGLVMGQVKILKRGEVLNPIILSEFSNINIKSGSDLCSTDRLGPDPEIVQKHIRVSDLYAGVSAPPPCSLPFPSAFVSRTVVESGLKKLLRI